MTQAITDSFKPVHAFAEILSDAWQYGTDAIQRSVMFADIIRERGNIYFDHRFAGRPPVLVFDYEIIMDGKDLNPPSNYKLARIIPPRHIGIDPAKRPIIIIDPRAGHGPGIGGSKRDSEIGMALNAGHPVYFILFDTFPLRGQTIADVEKSEIRFIEEVGQRHPHAPRPAVIGNCQAGWALVMLSADRPGTTGPIILNGSPLSYWAGVEGKDTLRYLGGLMGGAWVNAFLSDMGGGLFDGANLVMNFELMNWGNTFWKKQYNVYAGADTERERYLEFERWWNGFFHMSKEEIVFIVTNLFIGNKLEKGGLRLNEDRLLDLKEIKDPIVVFCSGGDNITPPQQALNWIFHVWDSTGEIKRRQQVIVYVLHKDIGHLGIFVSGKVAQKEHKELIGSYDMIEYLPPGLYEMVIENKVQPSSSHEYEVRFEERRLEDIMLMNTDEDVFTEEEQFPLATAVSDRNYELYEKYFSPFIKAWIAPPTAEFLRQLHPQRASLYLFSDMNPFMFPIQIAASEVRSYRCPALPDNPFLQIEKAMSDYTAKTLDSLNTLYSRSSEMIFKAMYDRFSPLNYFFPELKRKSKATIRELVEKRRERREFKKADREKWMQAMTEGGFVEGLVRLLLAIGTADGDLNREYFYKVEDIAKGQPRLKTIRMHEFRKIARKQARILKTEKYWAIKTLAQLLPTEEEQKEVLKICKDVFQDHLMDKEAQEIIRVFAPERDSCLPVTGKKAKVGTIPARKKDESETEQIEPQSQAEYQMLKN